MSFVRCQAGLLSAVCWSAGLPAVVCDLLVRGSGGQLVRVLGCHLFSTFSLESLLNQFLIIAFGIIAEVSQTLFLGGALQKIGCSTGGTLDVDRLLP